jgi:hypothetical protein
MPLWLCVGCFAGKAEEEHAGYHRRHSPAVEDHDDPKLKWSLVLWCWRNSEYGAFDAGDVWVVQYARRGMY